MPAARRRHFGNVRRLPSGRYQARYWHAGADHAAPSTFPTKAGALAWLSAAETDIHRGVWTAPRAGKVTLSGYSATWLAGRTDLRSATRSKYQHMLDRHVLPVLGGHELATLSPSAVRSWYMAMREKYVTTADDAYRMLRAVLMTAVADSLIAKSPCQVKGAGNARSTERPVLSVAELAAAAEAVPDRHRLAVLLCAWCQLRRGEVLGLQRRDAALAHGVIRVERAVVRPMSGPVVVGPPKTEAGARSLAVPAHVLPLLEHHLGSFVEAAPESWLFTSESGGPMVPSTLNRAWQRARLTIGRPDLFVHDLRHSGLTWAAASGASVAELMRRGGHGNPRAAMRYQHATEERDRAIADALSALATRQDRPAEGAEPPPGGGALGSTEKADRSAEIEARAPGDQHAPSRRSRRTRRSS
jgi:integrase